MRSTSSYSLRALLILEIVSSFAFSQMDADCISLCIQAMHNCYEHQKQ
jgi:hypothetical protein